MWLAKSDSIVLGWATCLKCRHALEISRFIASRVVPCRLVLIPMVFGMCTHWEAEWQALSTHLSAEVSHSGMAAGEIDCCS